MVLFFFSIRAQRFSTVDLSPADPVVGFEHIYLLKAFQATSQASNTMNPPGGPFSGVIFGWNFRVLCVLCIGRGAFFCGISYCNLQGARALEYRGA